MKVYVRGYRGKSLFSKAIYWITRGEYSHVSIVFSDKDSAIEHESLEGKGVIEHAPNTHETHDFDEFFVPLTFEQAESARIIARGLVGSDYDRKGIYGFLIHKKTHDPFKWFCAEDVAYILMKVGYPLSRREPYRETPASVMESLRLVEPVNEQGGA